MCKDKSNISFRKMVGAERLEGRLPRSRVNQIKQEDKKHLVDFLGDHSWVGRIELYGYNNIKQKNEVAR